MKQIRLSNAEADLLVSLLEGECDTRLVARLPENPMVHSLRTRLLMAFPKMSSQEYDCHDKRRKEKEE